MTLKKEKGQYSNSHGLFGLPEASSSLSQKIQAHSLQLHPTEPTCTGSPIQSDIKYNHFSNSRTQEILFPKAFGFPLLWVAIISSEICICKALS